ncbi:uncharacterized protein LOC124193392 isoform X3 [Daphnia pulex]|uniref:uncharacterized protein LOC124193392 isoform X3 n=1 Tax=Daphnia pulex TaxID=6669 RepID=UPI001EE042D8|nr:uncharacterized protein LOC124193392 isoform X3 [Daphnia pulex]
MGSWLERIYGCCSSADWCWWPNSRKYNPAAASGRDDDDDDDALIEATTGSFESNSGSRIAMLSRGKIKYVKAGVVNHTGSSHIGIPIIDPLIGQDYNNSSSGGTHRQNHHQRQQLFTQLHQHARLLVNKNIFHWHQQTHHQHQWWWDSSTPPSSVDLEWEHEGLMPPVMESASEDGEAEAEDQDEVDLYDTADEGEAADEGTRATDVMARTTKKTAGPNDPVAPHRSPSPSSACHSLEWDSNGDDFFGHDCRTHNIKAFSS